MATLQLRSTNPKFSFIIVKNPASGLMGRPARLGSMFGWFSPGREDTYNVYFKDADNEISFKRAADESYEYLDKKRYCSALFPMMAIEEFFSTASKKLHEEDKTGFTHTLLITSLRCKGGQQLEIFKKHFKNYNIKFWSLLGEDKPGFYSVEITTKETIQSLLSFTNILCLMTALNNNEEYVDFSDDLIKKYVTCLSRLDAPYFIRYGVKCNLLTSNEKFNTFKELLQVGSTSIEFTPGGNQEARLRAVSAELLPKTDICDIGCGEGYYVMQLARKRLAHYHAIDINEEIIEDLNIKIKNKQLEEKVSTYTSYEAFVDSEPTNGYSALLVEVIEHMSTEESKDILSKLLRDANCRQIIITTPNKDFNKYYGLAENEFRHPDHKLEFTDAEFKTFIDATIYETVINKVLGLSVAPKYIEIGDKVNGITPTIGVVFTK